MGIFRVFQFFSGGKSLVKESNRYDKLTQSLQTISLSLEKAFMTCGNIITFTHSITILSQESD
jgi:hypothetical protein